MITAIDDDTNNNDKQAKTVIVGHLNLTVGIPYEGSMNRFKKMLGILGLGYTKVLAVRPIACYLRPKPGTGLCYKTHA